jgi:hypothetical protein
MLLLDRPATGGAWRPGRRYGVDPDAIDAARNSIVDRCIFRGDTAFGLSARRGPPYDAAMSERATVGSTAPDFVLPRSGGGDVTLSGYRGRPVVLAFLRGYA